MSFSNAHVALSFPFFFLFPFFSKLLPLPAELPDSGSDDSLPPPLLSLDVLEPSGDRCRFLAPRPFFTGGSDSSEDDELDLLFLFAAFFLEPRRPSRFFPDASGTVTQTGSSSGALLRLLGPAATYNPAASPPPVVALLAAALVSKHNKN
jgi:hypothetical protein